MDFKFLESMLREHEGERLKPYKCTADKTTIGVGRNLDDVGISQDESDYLLKNDMEKVFVDLQMLFPDLTDLPDKIQLVLADMRFNIGGRGIRGFKRMIAAVNNRDWNNMKAQMIDSSWFVQVGIRALNLIKMVDDVILEEQSK